MTRVASNWQDLRGRRKDREIQIRIATDGITTLSMSIAESRGMEDESSTAFDEFLQTPIMGRKKKGTEEQHVRDMEEGIKVSVSSHQAVTRGRRGGTPTVSTPREVSGGGGQSQEMQPQVVFGFCLLQGLRDNPMEDLHVAEVRDIDGEEVRFLHPPLGFLENVM